MSETTAYAEALLFHSTALFLDKLRSHRISLPEHEAKAYALAMVLRDVAIIFKGRVPVELVRLLGRRPTEDGEEEFELALRTVTDALVSPVTAVRAALETEGLAQRSLLAAVGTYAFAVAERNPEQDGYGCVDPVGYAAVAVNMLWKPIEELFRACGKSPQKAERLLFEGFFRPSHAEGGPETAANLGAAVALACSSRLFQITAGYAPDRKDVDEQINRVKGFIRDAAVYTVHGLVRYGELEAEKDVVPAGSVSKGSIRCLKDILTVQIEYYYGTTAIAGLLALLASYCADKNAGSSEDSTLLDQIAAVLSKTASALLGNADPTRPVPSASREKNGCGRTSELCPVAPHLTVTALVRQKIGQGNSSLKPELNLLSLAVERTQEGLAVVTTMFLPTSVYPAVKELYPPYTVLQKLFAALPDPVRIGTMLELFWTLPGYTPAVALLKTFPVEFRLKVVSCGLNSLFAEENVMFVENGVQFLLDAAQVVADQKKDAALPDLCPDTVRAVFSEEGESLLGPVAVLIKDMIKRTDPDVDLFSLM